MGDARVEAHERDEERRRERLLDAQTKAAELFAAVGASDIIRAGTSDTEASQAIKQLAADMFGVRRHWHKRIVRSGPHTLLPYQESPPDRVIEADDIVFADFGPLFEDWEADFGRTWVLGDDPVKRRLADDLVEVWAAARRFFDERPDVTGEGLHAEVTRLAEERGWAFGNFHCGHAVGQFPHEEPTDDVVGALLMEGNAEPLRRTDPSGRVVHWILEVHLVDRERQIGGFHEELLTI